MTFSFLALICTEQEMEDCIGPKGRHPGGLMRCMRINMPWFLRMVNCSSVLMAGHIDRTLRITFFGKTWKIFPLPSFIAPPGILTRRIYIMVVRKTMALLVAMNQLSVNGRVSWVVMDFSRCLMLMNLNGVIH